MKKSLNTLTGSSILSVLAAVLSTCLLFASCLLAQNEIVAATPTAKDPYKDFPKSGVLSGSYSMGGDSAAIPGPWAKKNSGPTVKPPISGSVSRASQKQWKAVVFNNSPDDFSVSLRVRQLNSNRKTVKTDNFSVSLKSGKSEERFFSATQASSDAEIDLLSWKKTSSSKPAEGEAEGDINEEQ